MLTRGRRVGAGNVIHAGLGFAALECLKCFKVVDFIFSSLKAKQRTDGSVVKILSHRGFWKEPVEQNSMQAFASSIDHGFGLETDIRDSGGRLVISHDLPVGGELGLDGVLRTFQGISRLPLALNIKSDGLAPLLKSTMSAYGIEDWFTFDMSVPDMRKCLDERLPVFARASDVEKDIPWVEEVSGIWFDNFSGDSYDAERIAGYLRGGKRVCVVSPELHQRPHLTMWTDIRALSDRTGLMICTDYPEQARQFFMSEG